MVKLRTCLASGLAGQLLLQRREEASTLEQAPRQCPPIRRKAYSRARAFCRCLLMWQSWNVQPHAFPLSPLRLHTRKVLLQDCRWAGLDRRAPLNPPGPLMTAALVCVSPRLLPSWSRPRHHEASSCLDASGEFLLRAVASGEVAYDKEVLRFLLSVSLPEHSLRR